MEKETIVKKIRELIGILGVTIEDIEVSQAAGHTLFTVKTPDSGILIGTRGETLHALNHIVKKMFEGEAEGEGKQEKLVGLFHLTC